MESTSSFGEEEEEGGPSLMFQSLSMFGWMGVTCLKMDWKITFDLRNLVNQGDRCRRVGQKKVNVEGDGRILGAERAVLV